MIPIVNHKYKYILLYSAKSGCTPLRSLYLSVHKDELNQAEIASLDGYHNLNIVQPYDPSADYSDYYAYTITRNPYGRVVSAFLDQYVYARNPGVQAMMAASPPDIEPDCFIEFLEYLKLVPDALRDTHFQSQGFFQYASMVVTPQLSIRYRLLGQRPPHAFGVNLAGDISNFNQHTANAFKRIFKGDKLKYRFALDQLHKMRRKNSSFYGERDYAEASKLSVAELDSMVFAPKPQDFYADARAIELVNEIYKNDFSLFGYSLNSIPHKQVSKEIELIPGDFDWKMYLRLNPDLPHAGITNERAIIRHYLENGRFETTPRAYKIEAPAGFDWRRYLKLNRDLEDLGIVSEEAAIEHYISYGIRQDRPTV